MKRRLSAAYSMCTVSSEENDGKCFKACCSVWVNAMGSVVVDGECVGGSREKE